jgi:tRNA dimethylallyltransferase
MAMSRTMAEAAPPLLLLLGPTASGKSALAMALANEIPLEIVSIDSAQVYRGMDIGTAKPTPAERARVAHHLIDVRGPHEPYSAADFVREATAAIADIRARSRLPLVVGGTMLYAKALLEGLSQLPAADTALRAKLEAEGHELGWPAMHARLAELDPQTAGRLKPGDSQRIQRALEVHTLSGQTMSELHAQARVPPVAGCVIALLPADRSELHCRIETRFDAMLAAGFLDEVRTLRASGMLNPDLPSMRSVGYRQAWQHLDGASDFDAFRTTAIAASRQLAKRQMTWLRSMNVAAAIDPFGEDPLAALRAAVGDAQPR